MHTMQRAEFVLVIQALAATYSRDATEAMLTGYWMGLEDVDLAGVKRAAAAAMHHSRFMPTVAELRELSGEMPVTTRAAVAWQAVRQAVCRYGYYDSVRFDDPVVTAALRNGWGGWIQFDEALERDEEKWIRKEFERLYVALFTSGRRFNPTEYLLGRAEMDRAGGAQDFYYVRRGQKMIPGDEPIPFPSVKEIRTGLPAVPARMLSAPKEHRALPAPVPALENIGAMPEDF
jgi:hypothetical protein